MGYGGRILSKKITAHTNDPEKLLINLTISGHVNELASITPKRVKLVGAAGEKITESVTIFPKEKYPFKIIKAWAKKKKFFTFKLAEIKQSKNAGYLLAIKNLKKDKGRYYDTIYLKTDRNGWPDIKINVFGNIIDKKETIQPPVHKGTKKQ